VGVVFRGLTVKGLGLGAALQPSVGDIFLGLPRFLRKLITKGPKVATAKSPVRELLSDFNGCIKPGEMLLVLGKPGSGCSTFLKVLGNQRFGYEGVQGDVTYGGTDAKKMAKDFRGEVLYNPEDDLHYATLTVKQTLKFALKTRTPGKESRNEGESRKDYVREFLRVVTKLFWIEHTLGTKVGNRKLLCPFQSYVVVARKLFQSQARWTPGSAKARKPIYRIRHLSHNDISPATSGQNHHGYLGIC
jgi:ATP-binding cassette subfamily G (WHITE) protein 2 (SNQ2)